MLVVVVVVQTTHSKKVQNAGWKLGRTSLENMKPLGTTLLEPQNTAMLDYMLTNMHSSVGAGFLQQKRSTSHCSCCCCCSCYCCG